MCIWKRNLYRITSILHPICNQLGQNKGKNLHINYGQTQFTGTGIMAGGHEKNTDKNKGERR